MSSSTLSRSMLEAKTKDELTTIATAMGGKPAANSRKAALVDHILALAGVSLDDTDEVAAPANGADAAAGTAATSPAAEAPSAGGDAEHATDADADAGEDGDEDDGDDADDDDDDDDADDGDDGPADADADDDDADEDDDDSSAGRTDRTARNGGGRADARADGPSARGNGRPDASGSSPEARSASQSGGAGGQGSAARGANGNRNDQQAGRDNGGGADQAKAADTDDDDDDSPNKRRRRRGRNRDRDQEDQWQGDPVDVAGFLDLREEGYGFLRVNGSLPTKDDVYIPVKIVRQYGLRKGDHLTGQSRPAGRSEKNPALMSLDTVNGVTADDAPAVRPKFEELTPLFPDEQLVLERDDAADLTCRIIDLLAPIGKGQRGLIVSPPKAGKTSVVKEIVRSVERNNPECTLIVLLVDERPEEVTDMQRWLESGEVVASTFDRPPEEHTMVAEMTIERAKRLVEAGEDVVIVLDGITRLARAYNLTLPQSGRVMSGGVDAGALYPPKRFFGAARNVEEGGSLTILATALVETGSRMDEVIFEEFKGTGNLEIRLDRTIAERRIYPAIDIDASSTRREEVLYDDAEVEAIWALRRELHDITAGREKSGAGLEALLERLAATSDNGAFLASLR